MSSRIFSSHVQYDNFCLINKKDDLIDTRIIYFLFKSDEIRARARWHHSIIDYRLIYHSSREISRYIERFDISEADDAIALSFSTIFTGKK